MVTLDDTVVLLNELKTGREHAMGALWNVYRRRLVGLARHVLRNAPRIVEDEEDVAVTAFHSFCVGAAEGRFPQLRNGTDAWRILSTITVRRAGRLAKRESRKASRPLGSLEANLLGAAPPPDAAESSMQELQRMFGMLDDSILCIVAYCKLEGLTNRQISRSIDQSIATVERKLKQIRMVWKAEWTEKMRA